MNKTINYSIGKISLVSVEDYDMYFDEEMKGADKYQIEGEPEMYYSLSDVKSRLTEEAYRSATAMFTTIMPYASTQINKVK